MIKLSCVILTGGKSTRMNGENKAFLKKNSQSFIEILIQELKRFDELFLSVDKIDKYKHLKIKMIEDEIKEIGPIGGLYSSLNHCQQPNLFICGSDMPDLKADLVKYLSEFLSSDYDCVIIQASGKTHPLCGIYSKSCLPVIHRMIENQDYKLMNLLKQVRTKFVILEDSRFSVQLVANCNTPNDYKILKGPSVFCVSGVKNSGKTTLVTKLIAALKADGYRVAVIKHDGHDFEMDVENTDTYKHAEAGSDTTLIFSKTKIGMVKKQESSKIEDLLLYVSDCDFVIIEGMKNSKYPKIEVVRLGNSDGLVCDESTLFAIASDFLVHHSIPVFGLNDATGLVELIKRRV